MTKFIAIVSGKGGVGKTTTTINLGQTLVNQGKRVMLVDADLATPNIGIHLGLLDPQGTLNGFLQKKQQFHDVVYAHPGGLHIIAASPAVADFRKTPNNFAELFEHADDQADIVLIDSPSGLGTDVQEVLKHVDEALIVVQPTRASVMDALKTIQLAHEHNTIVAGVVVNMVRYRHQLSASEIEEILVQPLLGQLPYDRKIQKALHRSAPLQMVTKWGRSLKELEKIANFLSLEQ